MTMPGSSQMFTISFDGIPWHCHLVSQEGPCLEPVVGLVTWAAHPDEVWFLCQEHLDLVRGIGKEETGRSETMRQKVSGN